MTIVIYKTSTRVNQMGLFLNKNAEQIHNQIKQDYPDYEPTAIIKVNESEYLPLTYLTNQKTTQK